MVDTSDFDIWKEHFGATTRPSNVAAQVPEPAAGALLLLLGALLVTMAKR